MITKYLLKSFRAVLVFALSFLLLTLPITSNLTAAEYVANQTQQETAQSACLAAERQAQSDISGSTWFIVGCLAGVIGWVIALVTEPSPPATALMGKSPEYVASYTDCYKKKGKGIKSKNALTGCFVGTGVTVLAYVVIFVALSESDEF